MKARILSFYQVVLAWLYLRIPREKLQNKIVKKFLGLFLCFCGGGDWINFYKKTTDTIFLLEKNSETTVHIGE